MFLKFERKKKRHILLSLFYKIDKLLPLYKEKKLKLYLDLEWIFERLAHEKSFDVFQDHPGRALSFDYLKSKLHSDFTVLDLGCNAGDLSFLIASHVKKVIGIDFNEALIRRAQQSYENDNLHFVHTEALEFLTKNTQKFDVLILSHILEHIDSPLLFLTNFKNFFQYIYVEVPDFERSPLNLYRKELNSSLIYSDADHIWEFDRISIKNLIEEAQLEILDQEYRFGVQKFWCKVTT